MTSNPKFVPPISYEVLEAVTDGRLKPLDFAVYCYLVSRVNWTPREADIRARFSIGSHTTYVSMLKRLRAAGLMTKGAKASGNQSLPPVVSRSGVYERDLASSSGVQKVDLASSPRGPEPGPKSGLHTYQQNEVSDTYQQNEVSVMCGVQKVDLASGPEREVAESQAASPSSPRGISPQGATTSRSTSPRDSLPGPSTTSSAQTQAPTCPLGCGRPMPAWADKGFMEMHNQAFHPRRAR